MGAIPEEEEKGRVRFNRPRWDHGNSKGGNWGRNYVHGQKQGGNGREGSIKKVAQGKM